MTYVPNPEFYSLIAEQDSYAEAMQTAAEDVAEIAMSIAPVDYGDYQASIYAKDGYLCSDDPAAEIIEFGWMHGPAFAVLRRATVMAGFDLQEHGKGEGAGQLKYRG